MRCVTDPGPLGSAYAYGELGLRVVPVCSPSHGCASPGKIPFDPLVRRHLAAWHRRGVPEVADVDSWLQAPGAEQLNIGTVLGEGLVGLDVDGLDGERILRQRSAGDLPPTWEFTTAAGRRLLYASPPGMRLAKTSFQGEDPHSGLDILADGTQTVLPPSFHTGGTQYHWAPERDPWQAGPPAPAPAWLLAGARSAPPPHAPQAASDAGWWKPLLEGMPTGARHLSAARVIGRWAWLGLSTEEILLLAAAWNRKNLPPLPETEVERLVGDLVQRTPPQALHRRVVASG